jgi:hypothetical protein
MTPDADGDGLGFLGEVQRLAIARVRFGVPDQVRPLARLRRARLVVELQIASVPADRRGTFEAVIQRSRGPLPVHATSGDLVNATAAYFAQWVDNQTRIVWVTPRDLAPANVSVVLDSCQQSLLDSVRRQVEGLAVVGGAPAPVAELAGGIGTNLVLEQEMRLKEVVSSFIDICVMAVGFATGQLHLVACAGKHLLHSQFNNALEHGASELLQGFLSPATPGALGPGGPETRDQPARGHRDQPMPGSAPPATRHQSEEIGGTGAAQQSRGQDTSGTWAVGPKVSPHARPVPPPAPRRRPRRDNPGIDSPGSGFRA